jgi:hypothetical protein
MMIINSKGFKNLDKSYFDKKITLVLMKNTDLETVGENSFVGLNALKILSLNYNAVKKVHKAAFRDLVNLEKIEMVNNVLESLDDELFLNLVNLKLVLLYGNQLKVISTKLFGSNTKLESIQLQNNQIVQIQKDFYAKLTSLTRVDFSNNICMSENIVLTRFVQWSSHKYKFKDCYNNYALMDSTNVVINSVRSKLDELETKVVETQEKVTNDMKILEGQMINSTELDDIKTNLIDFFKNDKETIEKNYKSELIDIASEVRMNLTSEVKTQVEEIVSKKQDARQEKLVSHDFESLRDELSGKFTFVYCLLVVTICFVLLTTFFIFQRMRIFPQIGYQNDNRNLIEPE